jgi:hypothetical protein
MAVSDGQNGNASTFNAAFVSKNIDSTVISKITLNDPSPESGDSISNVQEELNNKTFKPFVVEQISAGGAITTSITLGMQRRKVVSDGGNISAAAQLFGAVGGWPDGTQIRLVGTDNTNSVTIEYNDIDYGLIINGNFTLTKHARITLEWDADELRWVEIQRIS